MGTEEHRELLQQTMHVSEAENGAKIGRAEAEHRAIKAETMERE